MLDRNQKRRPIMSWLIHNRGVISTVLISLLSAFPLSAIANEASQLSIQVDGLQNQEGQICMSLFNNRNGFPDQANTAVTSQCVEATAGQPMITFRDLVPGSYAVVVLHDMNSDNEMNQNFLGIPNEGFGFSGNPVIRFGPPEFDEALVVVAGPRTDIQVQLKYF